MARVARCAYFIPGGLQCTLPMYHQPRPCVFEPPVPFSEYVYVKHPDSNRTARAKTAGKS